MTHNQLTRGIGLSRLIILLAVLFIAAIPKVGFTQTTSTISYQGAIANTAGMSADSGTYSITVSFYTDESGTQPLWQDTFGTFVKNGIFNIALGSGRPLPPPSDLDRPIWVGVRVGSTAESRPLNRLTAVPMAMNVADSAITSAKMATDYVSSISVNGQKVTGQASNLNIVAGDGVNLAYDDASNSLVLNTGAMTMDSSGKGAKAQSANGGTGTTNTPDTCHTNSDGGNAFNTVAGGCGNTIHTPVDYSFIGGGTDNTITNVIGGNPLEEYNDGHVIGGGEGNLIYTEIKYTTENGLHGYGTIAGGQANTLCGPVWCFIGGGDSNIISSENPPVDDDHADFMAASVISGGQSNSITTYSLQATIGGGYGNQIHGFATGTDSLLQTANQATIGGGESNTATNAGATIAGGSNNQATGIVSIVAGGSNNTASGQSAAIGGGSSNTASGSFSSIPGGHNLTIGDSSLGFNAGAFTDLSSESSMAYLGNVNLWLGNVNNTAQAIRFYSPNTSSTYSGAKFSSFQAGGQTANIEYTLPTLPPDSMGRVLGVSSISGSSVSLEWQPNGSGGGGLAGWLLTGNAGVPPPANYLGTNDDQAFEIHIDNLDHDTTGGNMRVMRYEEGALSPNILGGSSFNTIDPNQSGVAILSGGTKLNPNKINTSDTFSIVAGGCGNIIDTLASYSAILSGQWNHITGHAIVPDSGWHNGFDVIAGGRGNFMGADTFRSGFNFIGGGDSNFVGWGCYDNVIGGGKFDTAANAYGVVGGGYANLLNGPGALNVIAGGGYNTVGGVIAVNANILYSIVGGGYMNMIDSSSSYSAILGGWNNYIGAMYDFVGGGVNNRVFDAYSSIVGGQSNTIYDVPGLTAHSFLGGGIFNSINCNFSVIAGGTGNIITTSSAQSNNTITGGSNNLIAVNASNAFIGGGIQDTVYEQNGAIGGGFGNAITAGGISAAIPGGDHLIAQSYAQFVAGRYNIPQGTSTLSTINGDDFLAIFGNGISGAASNAATIANRGYLTLYGENGTGRASNPVDTGGTPARYGSYYANNGDIAWVDVPEEDSVTFPHRLQANADFGVWKVEHRSHGVYLVYLNTDSLNTLIDLKHASITVTIQENDTSGLNFTPVKPITPGDTVILDRCGYATASQIGILNDPTVPHLASAFIVRTYAGSGLAGCVLADRAFFVHVTGRKD